MKENWFLTSKTIA